MTKIQRIMLDFLYQSPLIPVLQIEDKESAIPLASALKAGGIDVLEITLRSPAAFDAIEDINKEFPDMLVGAGTVINGEQLKKVRDLGAKFAISPGTTEQVLTTAKTLDMPLLPGVTTVSDVMRGLEHDFAVFKFFPAEQSGGIAALKAFAGPFPSLQFCPTGGITPDNAKDYLSLVNVVSIGGSWLAPSNLIRDEKWEQITNNARASLSAIAAVGR